MFDYNARHIIEALRSGVPSRLVGQYFSEARPGMMSRLNARLDVVREENKSTGMIFTGRYGEGKTHLLNTAYNLASSGNMVVSMVSLGKETPIDKPWLLYRKLMANTCLPGTVQPGFRSKLEEMTPGSSLAGEMLTYAATELETNRLFFLLHALLRTQEEEERAAFMADLEGDFAPAPLIKKSYRRISGKPAKFTENFSKTRHFMDYFHFMSHLFRQMGYDGWVILLDECELIGRMSKKIRAKSYARMQTFLKPDSQMEKVFTLMAFSASFAEDVIDKKHEFDCVEEVFAEDPENRKAAQETLNAILAAPELAPLTREEIRQVLMSIQKFHALAYDWRPELSAETIDQNTEAGGYLLRTKIRAAIEYFDQLYQYGEAGKTRITELGKESFEEDDTPELPEDTE